MWDRLNPFFIRSAVGIPPSGEPSQLQDRLNPFFIRSAVGMRHEPEQLPSRGVLIPSSSGLRLEFQFRIVAAFDSVLIPSSSGLRLESRPVRTCSSSRCLNPFFIRSAVGIPPEREPGGGGCVLIPSSSGLRLEYSPLQPRAFVVES